MPGVLTAQYYPAKHRLDIAIVDAGRGIMASLSQSQQLWSHGDAISKAIQRGVTRDDSVGQGNGMAGTAEIVRKNGGELHVWTGDANFTIREGDDRGFKSIDPVPGTGVFLRLDTRCPVRLQDTFISDPGWSFIDYATERIVESGGIRIVDECVHTGGREPAKALRRKLEVILPELEVPLRLSFEGVNAVSSSFLDELLGRLVQRMGLKEFAEKVKVTDASTLIIDMANVVIQQRMDN